MTMETVLQIAAVCLVGAVLAAVLRQRSPEAALLLGLAVCAVVGALLLRGLADVLDMPIRVVRSEQTCALGAAMFAAVAAGVYKDINEATRHMGSDIEAEYRPDEKRALIYEKLYKKCLELAKLAETIN